MNQDRNGEGTYHRPVMVQEVADLFRPLEEGVVIDATYGGGGHTTRLLEELGERVRIIGIDRDGDATVRAQSRGHHVLAGDFRDLGALLADVGIREITGILFDFGVSSHQLDTVERGFSYHSDAPLDMRMDPSRGRTAADIVNDLPVSDLERIIRVLGEDKNSLRIARAIAAARPLTTTTELSDVVAASVPARDRRAGHPARKTFQAIRIAVNDELEAIRVGLDAAIDMLAPAGRCVAISYHSLEDRIVKRRFADGSRGCVCPPGMPVCGCGAAPELRLLTHGALRPSEAEVATNPRSRSARLRAAEKARAA